MASAKATIDLDLHADDVWDLIGGFGSLPDWMPTFIPKSTLVKSGRVRQLVTADGQSIVEQLERYERSRRSYSYSILQASFPVTDYLATITVTPIESGNTSHVEWSGTFTPKGVSDEEAHNLFQGIFNTGLEQLAISIASKSQLSPSTGATFMTKSKEELVTRRIEAHSAHTDIPVESVRQISGAFTALLADVFALYIKTKNFHWHMSGPHFRDYHLLLDDQGDQIFAMTDDIAERVRKIGGTTLRSVGHIARVKRIADNDASYVTPQDMLAELWEDNKSLILSMRSIHDLCDDAGDVASASLIENWIDETQRRSWFLYEMCHG
ncbi:SRPBCC family protein [Acidicapsa ligni]|uniref:SRPBCC family protein n=1 Tax=Acidicapsa ligni TaxID=542300 RepID=UPI0021DFC54F|nr:SRPBCC family protein [Acidicapsa ligni]